MLDDLVRRQLLSDARFVEQYTAARQRRGFGEVRIRQELRERGVDDELIEGCLDQQEETWMEVLRRAHDKKFGIGPPESLKEKARRVRFLEYRGFTGEQIKCFFQSV